MILEYVAGRPLNDVIPTGGMPVASALGYAIQMADALTAAHGAGIFHRDLKPSNVMITEFLVSAKAGLWRASIDPANRPARLPFAGENFQ